VSPASTQECVLAIAMANWTGMEAIDWSILDGHANLSVLTAAEGHVAARSQVVAGDLQRQCRACHEAMLANSALT
jgi:hypothetical protein